MKIPVGIHYIRVIALELRVLLSTDVIGMSSRCYYIGLLGLVRGLVGKG